MSKYDALIDEIRMAEATNSPCVLITAQSNSDETATEIFRVNAPVYAVVGLLEYGKHIVTHKIDNEIDING